MNSAERIHHARVRAERSPGAWPIDSDEALSRASTLLSGAKRIIGIGSPRASLEANFALRTLVGPENFYAGVSKKEWRLSRLALDIMQSSPAKAASLLDVACSDAALILGEDVTQTAPRLALALRQSARQAALKAAAKMHIPHWDAAGVQNATQGEKGPVFIASASATRLDDIATGTYRASPDDIARLGFAVAHALDSASPPVPVLSSDLRALAAEIVGALRSADQPVVVSGSGCGSEAVMQAAANVAQALCRKGRTAKLALSGPECNSMGLALVGGENLQMAFDAVTDRDAVMVLENDLYRRAAASAVDAFLKAAGSVIVIEHTEGATVDEADIVLPAATFAESDGTLVNNESRAQRFYSVMTPRGESRESWRWLRDLAIAIGRKGLEDWANLDAVDNALASALPVFAPVPEIAPPAGFRIAGERVARQPHRYSGRTSMFASVSVHEQPPPEDVDAPLAYSMEGFQGDPPSALIPRFWAPGWNSVQALNKFQEEIAGPLRGGDPGRTLIEPPAEAGRHYFTEVPRRAEASLGRTLFVPAHHIFGSEKLSALSPAIARLTPEPYAGISRDDANGMSIKAGDVVEVSIGSETARLPAKIIDTLPSGLVALPAGLPGQPTFDLPARGELRRPRDEKGGSR